MALRPLLALLCVLALVIVGCGSDDEPGTTEAAAPKPKPKPACEQVEQPKLGKNGGHQKPTAKLDPSGTYDAVVDTSCGSFTIRLDQKQSPNAAASFAKLARDGFFDDTTFHRIAPGFVIQGGDPRANSTGGPGYMTVDKPPADATYTQGVVAMAKEGTDPPGTAGSQFFVVTASDAGLPPDYAIVGKVTEGMKTVREIEALGNPDESPKRPVVVETVSVDEQ